MADTKVEIPDAPKHLPANAKKQWQDSYAKAFTLAARDNPDDESAQRAAATKAANAMLTIDPPQSAADIDKLEDWQVLTRDTRDISGVSTRVCVTSDGRKYAFPVDTKKSTK